MDTRDEFVARLRRGDRGVRRDRPDPRRLDPARDRGRGARRRGQAADVDHHRSGRGRDAVRLARRLPRRSGGGSSAAHPATSIAEARDQLAAFLDLELTPEERVQADRIQRMLDPTVALDRAGGWPRTRRCGATEPTFVGLRRPAGRAARTKASRSWRSRTSGRRIHEAQVGHPSPVRGQPDRARPRRGRVHRRGRPARVPLGPAARGQPGAASGVRAAPATSEAARIRLLHELVSAQEKERGRLARELHDQMGQDLSALMLGLKRLLRPARFGARDPAARSELLRSRSSPNG